MSDVSTVESHTQNQEAADADDSYRILLADDDALNRRLVRALLEHLGHEVVTAENGEEAVAEFNRQAPDIVLMDVSMPVMDGLESTRLIKEASADRFVPVIFLTAAEGADALQRCVQCGGDDFLSKPVNEPTLHAKIRSFGRIGRLHEKLRLQKDNLVRHSLATQAELEVAEQVFQRIMSRGALDSGLLSYRISPASLFNGDLLVACHTPSGALRVLLADFTGHGLPAAIGALPTSEIFYAMTRKGCGVPDIVYELNRRLLDCLPQSVFCAAALIDFDEVERKLEIWNGGLPDLLLVPASGGPVRHFASRHLALGIRPARHEYGQTEVVPFSKNARIYGYTDGLIESVNAEGEMFGMERLEELLASGRRSDDVMDLIVDAQARHGGGSVQEDDITVFELRSPDFGESQGGETSSFVVPTVSSESSIAPFRISWEFPVEAIRHTDPVPLIMHVLGELGFGEGHSSALFVILSELFNNAVDHGLLNLSSELKQDADGFLEFYASRASALENLTDGRVRFDIEFGSPSTGGALEIVVEDDGPGFDPKDRCGAEEAALHGRGLRLVESLTREMTFMGRGNRVRVVYDPN